MAWVRIDDAFADHPKIRSVGAVGMAIQVAAICYCNRYLTDGFLSWSAADALIAGVLAPITGMVAESATASDNVSLPKENAMYELGFTSGMSGVDAVDWHWPTIMVNAGLWDLVENGYVVHDYPEYNPTKEEVLAAREQRKNAAKKAAESTNKKRWGSPETSPSRRQSGDSSGDNIVSPKTSLHPVLHPKEKSSTHSLDSLRRDSISKTAKISDASRAPARDGGQPVNNSQSSGTAPPDSNATSPVQKNPELDKRILEFIHEVQEIITLNANDKAGIFDDLRFHGKPDDMAWIFDQLRMAKADKRLGVIPGIANPVAWIRKRIQTNAPGNAPIRSPDTS